MKKLLFSSFSATIIVLALFLQSCKHNRIEIKYDTSIDPMFASIDSAYKIAQNINKHEIVMNTIGK